MQDNDLRGFLDGRFIEGWNQVGQIHVRAGRRPYAPVYGEYGLFRIIHRWDGIRLPTTATVVRATLSLEVEFGPDRELEVLLYPVHKDWNPGEGGTQHDNTSPPVKGEVWWRDVAFQDKPWGLPGAGFASDDRLDADTSVMPLAGVHFTPGDARLVFSSTSLDAYIQKRIEKGRPLLFLIKLSDPWEDERGSMMGIYSADHGDLISTARRPTLRLQWTRGGEINRLNRKIFLEHGRTLRLPRMASQGVRFMAASFICDDGYEAPTIEVRGGNSQEVSDWQTLTTPVSIDWDWVELRILAVRNPVVLGNSFTSEVHDTWVRTKPPEQQRVTWTFISPSGLRQNLDATYLGDYRWKMAFEPTELGRWSYVWTQQFVPNKHYRSPEGVFDVIVKDQDNLGQQLEALLERIRTSDLESSKERIAEFGEAFYRLERAAMQFQDPDSFRSEAGQELLAVLKQLREVLSGGPVPDVPKPAALKRTFPD